MRTEKNKNYTLSYHSLCIVMIWSISIYSAIIQNLFFEINGNCTAHLHGRGWHKANLHPLRRGEDRRSGGGAGTQL